MPKIILLNTSSDVPKDLLTRGPGLLPAWRQVWWVRSGDIIVSPVPIAGQFFDYAGRVLREDLSTVRVIVAPDACQDDQALASPDFKDQLLQTCIPGQTYELLASSTTPALARLAEELIAHRDVTSALAHEGANELLNRKSYFRRLAAGAAAPLAEGRVVTERSDLASAITVLQEATGAVIVKRENAGGGYGNVVISDSAVILPGAQRTVRYRPENVSELASELWDDLTDAQSHSVVVESYHPATHMFYFEFEIEHSGSVRYFDSGDVRLREDDGASAFTWLGLQVPATLPAQTGRVAHTEATKLATHLSTLGYRGYVNIDCIVTATGRVIINEFNCRWGGGTIVHIFGTRTLGEHFGDSHFIRWVRDVPYLPLAQALQSLEEGGLDPYAETDTGVCILTIDPDKESALEFAIRGRSASELDELESRAYAALQKAASEAR